MTNIKKLDDHDVVFVDRPWTDQEKKEFSALLKKKKAKLNRRKNIFSVKKVKRIAS